MKIILSITFLLNTAFASQAFEYIKCHDNVNGSVELQLGVKSIQRSRVYFKASPEDYLVVENVHRLIKQNSSISSEPDDFNYKFTLNLTHSLFQSLEVFKNISGDKYALRLINEELELSFLNCEHKESSFLEDLMHFLLEISY